MPKAFFYISYFNDFKHALENNGKERKFVHKIHLTMIDDMLQ